MNGSSEMVRAAYSADVVRTLKHVIIVSIIAFISRQVYHCLGRTRCTRCASLLLLLLLLLVLLAKRLPGCSCRDSDMRVICS